MVFTVPCCRSVCLSIYRSISNNSEWVNLCALRYFVQECCAVLCCVSCFKCNKISIWFRFSFMCLYSMTIIVEIYIPFRFCSCSISLCGGFSSSICRCMSSTRTVYGILCSLSTWRTPSTADFLTNTSTSVPLILHSDTSFIQKQKKK